MPVTGDFGELDNLIERFRDLEGGDPQEALSRNLAEEALDLVAEGFEEHKDPYGSSWAPLTSRSGDTLRDTSHLANSFHVHDVSADQFTVKTGVWYGVVHQTGQTIVAKNLNKRGQKRLVFKSMGQTVFARQVTIPQRRMLPDAGDIPASWRIAFDEVAEDFLNEFFE